MAWDSMGGPGHQWAYAVITVKLPLRVKGACFTSRVRPSRRPSPLSRNVLRLYSTPAGSSQFEIQASSTTLRVAKLLGLAAGQAPQPGFGLGRDRRLSPLRWPIIERRNGAAGRCAFNAAPHSLMMHGYSPSHGVKGRVFRVGEQHSRPLDPARRLRPRTRHRIGWPADPTLEFGANTRLETLSIRMTPSLL
jgi:hypothetical protein